MEYFNKDNLSYDKTDLLINCIQTYKNEYLRDNGHDYECFSIKFLDELLKELQTIHMKGEK